MNVAQLIERLMYFDPELTVAFDYKGDLFSLDVDVKSDKSNHTYVLMRKGKEPIGHLAYKDWRPEDIRAATRD